MARAKVSPITPGQNFGRSTAVEKVGETDLPGRQTPTNCRLARAANAEELALYVSY